MSKAICLVVLCSSTCWAADSSDIGFTLSSSLPRAFWENLRATETHEPYSLAAWLNPFYLQGDFNGDGDTDIAVLAEERDSRKRGVLIIHMGAGRQFIIGAGTAIGNGGDDFTWMDAWQVYPRGVVDQGAELGQAPPNLIGDALLVIKTEAASGLVYWTGTQYEWYQQGD